VLFDHLDGTVARYRRAFSALGSFYDKTGAIVTWALISAAFGWRAYLASGDAILILLPIAAAYALAVRGYMKWLVVAEGERLRWTEAAADPAAAIARRTAPPVFSTPPERDAAAWLRWFAKTSIQFYRFEECDLFFWVGLALAIGRLEWLCWVLFVTQTIGMIGMIVQRTREVARIDRGLGR
jgi:hypothetical protein